MRKNARGKPGVVHEIFYEAYIAWIYIFFVMLNDHRFSYLSINDSHSSKGSALE